MDVAYRLPAVKAAQTILSRLGMLLANLGFSTATSYVDIQD